MVRLVLAAAALLASPAIQAQQATVLLRPVTDAGAVTAIDVTLDVPAGSARPTLTAPIVYPGAPGVADRMSGITVTDAGGAVPLATRDDAAVPGGFPYFRHWQAGRVVRYPLRIAYRAAVQPPGGAGGPPFAIRAVGGGVVGAGNTILLLPDEVPVAATRLRWDLSALPAGSIASTSLGDGTDVAFAGGPETLMGAWILAGPAGRYPATGGFSATWLGKPAWDVPAAMAWSARGYRYLDGYFPHLKPTPPFRVFVQFRDAAPYGGGTALTHSLMLSRGPLRPGERAEAPRSTFFHELIHQWVGGVAEPNGINSWFSEGLTSYYQDLLQLRGGFMRVDDYGTAINALAEDYFTSKARNWSALAITKVGFGDEEVRHTPYRRSAMYFFDLDARIRAKSGGRRTLDSMLFPMFVAREKGERFDNARWIAMVTAELGPKEKGRFERLILDGTDTLDPRGDSFGPCFARQATAFAKAGRSIAGYRWVRVKGVADATCRAG